MKKSFVILILSLFVVSCAPSHQAIQTAIAQTQAANLTSISLPQPTSTVTPEIGNWRTNSSKSDFTDTNTVIVSEEADNSVTGWLDTETPTLFIRCKEKSFEIYINVGMQFDVESGLYDQSTIRFRFDKGVAFTMVADQSTDGKAVFITNPSNFLSRMLNSKVLVFGFTPFNASPVSTTFNLTGISTAVQPVLDACK